MLVQVVTVWCLAKLDLSRLEALEPRGLLHTKYNA